MPDTVATGTGSIIDSALGQHGTPIGSPLYAAEVFGCATRGLEFNGVDQRVFVPDRAEYAALRSLTVEATFSSPGYRPSPFGLNQVVFRGDDRTGDDPFFLAIVPDGRVAFFISNVRVLESPTPLPARATVHVAATLDDASGAAALFINGAMVATASTALRAAISLTGALPGLGLGNVQSGNYAEYFAGTIYEVRLSSVALTPAQMLPPPPAFAVQPAPGAVCPTGSLVMSAPGLGAGPFMYRWQLQTAPGVWTTLGNDPFPLPCGGAFAYASPINSPTVTIGIRPCPGSPTQPQHFQVRCIVTNACGSATSNEATYTICPADVNCSGSISVQDIFDFLAAYFAGDAATGDFNRSGAVSVQDIFDFLAAYFAGCG